MARYQLPGHVLRSHVDSRAVLLDTQRNRFYTLNATGTGIAGLLTDGEPVESAAEQMALRYGIELELARRDADTLVAALLDRGLIEPA